MLLPDTDASGGASATPVPMPVRMPVPMPVHVPVPMPVLKRPCGLVSRSVWMRRGNYNQDQAAMEWLQRLVA